MNDDWVHQFLRDCAESAARKQRGEPAAPVFYRDVGGKMQRVEYFDIERLVQCALAQRAEPDPTEEHQ
jgi:hypothetical protein